MFLSDIIIYPIKSMPGVRVKESKIEARGLQYDRRWMLVDENNKFITIRQHPELLLFDLQMQNEGFVVKHRETGDSIELPWAADAEGDRVNVKIWEDEVSALEVKAEWSSWIADKLGIACRLVYMDDQSVRPINEKWPKNGEIVSFADGYPILIIGSESLADLNGKLDQKITLDRFRPNLVFEGGEAYDEFKWGSFTIGKHSFQGLKPCARCVITTIDPVTLERSKEPLLTLSRQKVDDKIVFGQHAYALDFGTICIEDEIEVITRKDFAYDPV